MGQVGGRGGGDIGATWFVVYSLNVGVDFPRYVDMIWEEVSVDIVVHGRRGGGERSLFDPLVTAKESGQGDAEDNHPSSGFAEYGIWNMECRFHVRSENSEDSEDQNWLISDGSEQNVSDIQK